jgi:hypothetical protein
VILTQFDGEVATRCELNRPNAETVTSNLQSALGIRLDIAGDSGMCSKDAIESVSAEIRWGYITTRNSLLFVLFTQWGSVPGTQQRKGNRESTTPSSKVSPKTKHCPKHKAWLNEKAAMQA